MQDRPRYPSFVVRPHADDLHRTFRIEDLVDESMLDVDAAGICTCEVADQFLEGGRALPRIPAQDVEQLFGFIPQTAPGDLPGVFLSLFCEADPPRRSGRYHPGFSEVFESGVRSPFRIDSRMPGIERR